MNGVAQVDTDDCVSVAARSDTSWPRRPSQPDDCAPFRPHQVPVACTAQVDTDDCVY